MRDHLHILFAPGQAIVVTAIRDIASTVFGGRQPGRRGADGRGPHRSRLGLGPVEPEFCRSRRHRRPQHHRTPRRQPRRGIHSALLDSFRPIERLLGNEGLGALYDETGRVRELQLHPDRGRPGHPATTGHVRCVPDGHGRRRSPPTSRPQPRSTPISTKPRNAPSRAISHVFDIHAEESGPLTDREDDLVRELKPTMERVAEVLLIDTGQAYSLNELSRLVFDTFQGRLTITLDGPIDRVRGLCRGRDLHRTSAGEPVAPPRDLGRPVARTGSGHRYGETRAR